MPIVCRRYYRRGGSSLHRLLCVTGTRARVFGRRKRRQRYV